MHKYSYLKILGIWALAMLASSALMLPLSFDEITIPMAIQTFCIAIFPLVFAYTLIKVEQIDVSLTIFAIQVMVTIFWTFFFGLRPILDTFGLLIYIASMIIVICFINLREVKSKNADSAKEGGEMVIRKPEFLRGIVLVSALVALTILASSALAGLAFTMEERRFFADLSRQNLSQQEAVQAIDDMQKFKINGQLSGSDWIVAEQGEFEVVGAILPFSDTLQAGGQSLSLSVVAVPETVAGITVFHLLPLVVTDDTEFAVSEHSELSLYRARFSIQDKWLHAERIEELDRQMSEDSAWDNLPKAYISFFSLIYDERSYFPARTNWLDVSDGETFSFNCFESGGSIRPSNIAGIFDMQISNRFGSALISHSFQVYCERGFDSEWLYDTPVEFRDGRFVFIK